MSLRTSTAGPSERAFTLLELTIVLAVLGLAAGIVLPRLSARDAVALDVAARRLADGLSAARDRAILSGRPMRLVVDLDAGRWTVGRPAREAGAVLPAAPPPDRPQTLPAGVRVAGVVAGGAAPVRTGRAVVELAPAGDALPARIELVGVEGSAVVALPPASARAAVLPGGTP